MMKIAVVTSLSSKSNQERMTSSKQLKMCHVCSKTFKKVYNLKRHIKLHTGTKEFVCAVCSYEFIQKSDLIRHLATHSTVKSFVCNFKQCGKMFRTKRNMHSHYKTVHELTKKYKCKLCERQFKKQCLLRAHTNSVHDSEGKVYECDYCGKNFNGKNDLCSHLIRHALKSNEEPIILSNSRRAHPRYYFTLVESKEKSFEKVISLKEIPSKTGKLKEESIQFEFLEKHEEERNFLWSFLPLMKQMGKTEKLNFKNKIRLIIDKVLKM